MSMTQLFMSKKESAYRAGVSQFARGKMPDPLPVMKFEYLINILKKQCIFLKAVV